jgi:uncharacterized protein YggU (UPF0235/DUF167 family)
VAQANAEFIVRACNSHQDLVGTLNNALVTLKILQMPEGQGGATNAELLQILADSFKAALAKAKGETK